MAWQLFPKAEWPGESLPPELSALYLLLSGGCPEAQRTDLIWKLFVNKMPDLSSASPLTQIPARRPVLGAQLQHSIATYELCHLIQIMVCHHALRSYIFIIVWNKVELIHQSISQIAAFITTTVIKTVLCFCSLYPHGPSADNHPK